VNRQMRRASQANGRRMMRAGWSEWERLPLPDLRVYPGLRNVIEVWKNNLFIVQVTREQTAWGDVDRLLVRRNDATPVRSWSDLQRVKNELRGPERLAVEVFPPESQLVDDAHIYHLWVLPVGFELPFGLNRRQVNG
jgi:hypothetical protein